MKLTLEKKELIAIIGKALGYTLEDKDVTVSSTPFEVHLTNVDVTAMQSPEEEVVEESPEVPEEIQETLSEKILTMEELLQRNDTLKAKESLQRPLASNEFFEYPPLNSEGKEY